MKMLDRSQVRRLDERAVSEYGLNSLVLMENAGRGIADLLCKLAARGPTVICCGKGNNGGDGFVAARHLDLRRIAVEVLSFADPASLTGDAAANYRVLEKSGVPIRVFAGEVDSAELEAALSGAAWIVDALLGTGSHGDPRPPLDRVIDCINASGKPILAVDLPSGLDCDTGQPGRPTIRATHTCTFVAAKPGFFAPRAAEYTGQLHIADIGAPRKLVEEMLGASPSPQR
jgi:NAD(P)H-hydrate epimerase